MPVILVGMAAALGVSPSTTYIGAAGWPQSIQVMTDGRILPDERTWEDLLNAVARTVARYDARWASRRDAVAVGDAFAEAMASGRVSLGTPALSNVWSDNRPFSSCAAVPLDDFTD